MNSQSLSTLGQNEDTDNILLGSGVSLPCGDIELKADGSGTSLKDEGILVTPTPGFVIKTTTFTEKEPKKVMINVCYHEFIEQQSQRKKLDENGTEVEGLNVPVSIGPFRECLDKAGNPCLVVDTIVNPNVHNDITEDDSGSFRGYMCDILIQFIEQKYKHRLDPKYKLPKLSYFGYINVKNGGTVYKASVDTEVCKQRIRNPRKCPKIEEVVVSKIETSSKIKKNDSTMEKSDKVIVADDLESNNVFSDISFTIFLTLSSGEHLTLQDFIERARKNKCADGKNITDVTYDHKFYNFDQTSQKLILPLFCDACIKHENISVTSLTIQSFIPDFEYEKAQVTLSSFILQVNYNHPKIARLECILPFSVLTRTASCRYIKDISTFEVTVEVCQTCISDNVDPGSHQWLLTHGLSEGKECYSKKNIVENYESKEDDVTSSESSTLVNKEHDDDPYQLRSRYFNFISTANSINHSSSQKQTTNNDEKVELPEDRFHNKDSLSLHFLQQQEEERLEKIKKSKERKQQQKDGEQSDESIEYISPDDFKPGGKYYSGSKSGGVSDSTNNNGCKSRKKEQEFIQEETTDGHVVLLKKAELMMKQSCNLPFQSQLWTLMME